MINGKTYDFESIKIQLPTGQVSTAESIKYGAKKDVDILTDKNGMPRGMARKAFEGDFEMDMSIADYEILSESAGAKGILGMDPFPIVVTYGDDGDPDIITDRIEVKVTQTPREASKDEEVRMTITGKQTKIPEHNGNPVYAKA